MSRRILISPLCVLVLGVCLTPGCGQNTAEVTTVDQKSANQSVAAGAETRQVEIRLDQPLTDAEVELFLQITSQFPGGSIPPFSSTDLPSLRHNGNLLDQLRHLRLAIRDALNPERQGREWRQDARLRSLFQRFQVEPEDFAVLSLKLSSAWSAQNMRAGVRSLEARQQVDRNITESALKLMQTSGDGLRDRPEDADRVAQQLIVLEELVALSEFLALTAQVPEESLEIIASHREKLASTLPHVQAGLSMAAEVR